MKCPKCGYQEPLCWHYPTYHGLEMPYARIEELELEDVQLAEKIRGGNQISPFVLEYADSCYAYKYNQKSGFVRRRELELWKIAKWNGIPMEKRRRHVKGKQLELVLGHCGEAKK